MKTALSFLCLSVFLLLGACSARYYQIYNVTGDNVQKRNGYLVYEDENCSVVYDMWCEGGTPDFVVVNKTDSILYIDMEHSFFIRNGISYDYFEDAVFVSGMGRYPDVESRMDMSFRIVKNIYPRSNSSRDESVSVSNVYASGDVSTKSGPSKYEFMVRPEREVLAIPPYGSKLVSKFMLWGKTPYSEDICSEDLVPVDSLSYHYSIGNSPLVFSNFITYSVGESGERHHIDNLFYVSGIVNVREAYEITKESYRCGKEPYPRTYTFMKSRAADRFYIVYVR